MRVAKAKIFEVLKNCLEDRFSSFETSVNQRLAVLNLYSILDKMDEIIHMAFEFEKNGIITHQQYCDLHDIRKKTLKYTKEEIND